MFFGIDMTDIDNILKPKVIIVWLELHSLYQTFEW